MSYLAFPEAKAKAVLFLGGLEPTTALELPNQYWPEVDNYAALRKESPWWFIKTPYGYIKIGWRKRVIEIDWSDTGLVLDNPNILTADDVTKESTYVHAWTYAKAVEYASKLEHLLSQRAAAPTTIPDDTQ